MTERAREVILKIRNNLSNEVDQLDYLLKIDSEPLITVNRACLEAVIESVYHWERHHWQEEGEPDEHIFKAIQTIAQQLVTAGCIISGYVAD
jgi:hypothetical protein